MTVKLKGEAKDAQGSKAGLYILGPNEVNGKSHWLQDSGINAIWYDKPNGNWKIGIQKNIGSEVSGLKTSKDVAGPQEATTWKYVATIYDNVYSGDNWITSDDISVDTFGLGA